MVGPAGLEPATNPFEACKTSSLKPAAPERHDTCEAIL